MKTSLETRFSKHKDILGNFGCLLPLKENTFSKEKLAEKKCKFVSLSNVKAEYELWNESFRQTDESVEETVKCEETNESVTFYNSAILALNK